VTNTELVARQLRLLQLNESEDSRSLGEAKEALESCMDRVLDEFYEHVHAQPELARLFASKESQERARRGQKEHWKALLFASSRGDRHFEMMRATGRAHLRVGLEPGPYLAAYCFVLNRFNARLVDEYAGEPDKLKSIRAALDRAAFLDMSFVIESYIDAKNEAMRDLLRRATRFTEDVSELVGSLKETAGGLADTANDLQALSESSPSVRRLTADSEVLSAQVDKLDDRLSQLMTGDRLRIVEQQSSGLRQKLKAFFGLGRSSDG